jgi:hypothetical protein
MYVRRCSQDAVINDVPFWCQTGSR